MEVLVKMNSPVQAEGSPDTAGSWQSGKRHSHYSGHRRGYGKGQQQADMPPELAGANRDIFIIQHKYKSQMVMSLRRLVLHRTQ